MPLATRPEDRIYVEHPDQPQGGVVSERGWAPERKARVWTRRQGEPQPIEVTQQVDRVVVSKDSIHIESGAQRITAKRAKESAPGLTQGTVESVS